MTGFSEIHETDYGMTLPDGVHVFARETALGNITILGNAITTHRIDPIDELPTAAIEQAAIVVVEIDSTNPASLARLEKLRAMRPGLPIIAGLHAAPVSTVRSLLRKGVADVLELPFASEEFVAAIVDVARSAVPAAAPVELAPVVAVLGAAGGSGATTVATQLAPLLAQGGKTALVDLSLQSGDAAAYLDQQARLGINQLLEAIDRVDDELMRSVAVDCGDGLYLFSAPEDIEPIESASPEALNRMLREIRKRYDIVVLDMPNALTNWAMSTLLLADVVVLVGANRISALRHVKRKLSLLQMLGRNLDSISIVLNRGESGLFKRSDTGQMEEILGHDIEQVLDYDLELVEESQLQGRSLSALQKRSRIAKQMAQLATSIGARIGKDI